MRRLVGPIFPPSYPQPLTPLQREGLGWLREAGIAVILDHHALPGVAAENQMFAGRYVRAPDPNDPRPTSIPQVHLGRPVLCG